MNFNNPFCYRSTRDQQARQAPQSNEVYLRREQQRIDDDRRRRIERQLENKHDLMIGWFSNAMMAMHDHIMSKKDPAQPVTTGEWQPIETAPNYKYVLVHYAKHITDLDPNWTWDENSERTFVAKREDDLWFQDFGPENFVIVEPTHWMEIPLPPTGLKLPEVKP